mgnify:CR=1 FL=1
MKKWKKDETCDGSYGGKGAWWKGTYADFGGDVGREYDYQVADYTKKHLRFFDRFNMYKVVAATQYSFSILSKSIEEPDPGKKNWKYFKDV